MAKRRKLEAPTAEDLGKIEEAFRDETPQIERKAPIARVAAEAAGMFQSGTPEMRRDEAQAAAYRVAEGQGRLIKQIDLNEIEAGALQRDRTIIDDEAMTELEQSIADHGLRLPIEVYTLNEPQGRKRYGLLSGYRRLIAQRNLVARTEDAQFGTIKAVLRDPNQMGGAFVAMVEENEIRQDLSHFERGRIAVIAAQQGAFASTEDAVAAMFSAASKAKRSKIRSFAAIFEELGDVLQFPENLREKDGLRLAQGLRSGAAAGLREALAAGSATNASSEWAVIDAVLVGQARAHRNPSQGGRPKKLVTSQSTVDETVRSATGVTVQRRQEGEGYVIQLSGQALSDDVLRRAMQAVVEIVDAR